MPTKKTWLLRLPEIRKALSATDVPVVDRAVFERLFGVRRRRAIQLLHFFRGFQSGRTFLIDRLSLIEQLVPLEASADFALEQRRRQRRVELLDRLRRARAGARVSIPVAAADQNVAALPAGVPFEAGTLRIAFYWPCRRTHSWSAPLSSTEKCSHSPASIWAAPIWFSSPLVYCRRKRTRRPCMGWYGPSNRMSLFTRTVNLYPAGTLMVG
jgi:hypothetical protein